jgi:hypothetical protein
VGGVYRSYPLRDVALYNGVTLLHFGLAAAGLLLVYDRWPVLARALAIVYLVVALGQMYVVMPLVVCVACVYPAMPRARCVSGMNVVAALLAFRILVIFRHTACPHCAAKGHCPNAKAMGIA